MIRSWDKKWQLFPCEILKNQQKKNHINGKIFLSLNSINLHNQQCLACCSPMFKIPVATTHSLPGLVFLYKTQSACSSIIYQFLHLTPMIRSEAALTSPNFRMALFVCPKKSVSGHLSYFHSLNTLDFLASFLVIWLWYELKQKSALDYQTFDAEDEVFVFWFLCFLVVISAVVELDSEQQWSEPVAAHGAQKKPTIQLSCDPQLTKNTPAGVLMM